MNDHTCFAIEGTPWNEWLGMPVDDDTLKELTPAQIVGYSMYEMTYFGWSEEEIRETISGMAEQE